MDRDSQLDRQTDRLAHLIMKYQPCGKRSQDDPSGDFCTVNVTATGYEAWNPASCMTVTSTTTMIMTCMYSHMCCVHTNIHSRTNTCLIIYMHAYIRTYIHTHTYIHIYISKPTFTRCWLSLCTYEAGMITVWSPTELPISWYFVRPASNLLSHRFESKNCLI